MHSVRGQSTHGACLRPDADVAEQPPSDGQHAGGDALALRSHIGPAGARSGPHVHPTAPDHLPPDLPRAVAAHALGSLLHPGAAEGRDRDHAARGAAPHHHIQRLPDGYLQPAVALARIQRDRHQRIRLPAPTRPPPRPRILHHRYHIPPLHSPPIIILLVRYTPLRPLLPQSPSGPSRAQHRCLPRRRRRPRLRKRPHARSRKRPERRRRPQSDTDADPDPTRGARGPQELGRVGGGWRGADGLEGVSASGAGLVGGEGGGRCRRADGVHDEGADGERGGERGRGGVSREVVSREP